MFICVRKLDSNSLTKTKNWSGRNEVTETSGRLHPLWPQNKWLHTPRTTDYRHTRQDRWIQTELASTLPKNATKQNPFEIIPLQTTRKENNWTNEEALARAAVTLETEWIKGSNPWCLWWWWLCMITLNLPKTEPGLNINLFLSENITGLPSQTGNQCIPPGGQQDKSKQGEKYFACLFMVSVYLILFLRLSSVTCTSKKYLGFRIPEMWCCVAG